jgi:large subunit ribosomal protein L9
MKVILKDNIKGVGKKNEVINASDGYARNFLFPKNLAVEATPENMQKLNSQNQAKQYRKDVEKEQATVIAKKLESITLEMKVQAGENGKIFGSVSSKEISESLEKQYKIIIDKKKIEIKEPIKVLGVRTVEARLFEGVTGKIKINVVAQ